MQDMIMIADTKVARRVGEYFIKQIVNLRKVFKFLTISSFSFSNNLSFQIFGIQANSKQSAKGTDREIQSQMQNNG